MSKIIRQNFKGDFLLIERFKRKTDQGADVSAVPNRLIIEYFTEYGKSKFTVSRNGSEFTNCSLSKDGKSLLSHIALSKIEIGTGALYHNVIELIDDPRFPDRSRYFPVPAKTNVLLCDGESDESATIESTVILQSMIYGYSAYQLALLNGFVGTEAEYVNTPLSAAALAVTAAERATLAIINVVEITKSATIATTSANAATVNTNTATTNATTATAKADVATQNAIHAVESLRRGVDGGEAHTIYGGCFVFDGGNANTI